MSAIEFSARTRHPDLQDEDRERVDRELSEFLRQDGLELPRQEPLHRLWSLISDFVLQGGKRVRPRLCLSSYRILSGAHGPLSSGVVQVAASLEVYHAFMLIHDDIVDESSHRRGRLALHQALAQEHPDPSSAAARKWGAHVGLIAGDLVFAMGHRLVAQACMSPTIRENVHLFISNMLFQTGLGQVLDVWSDALPIDSIRDSWIEDTYLRKTAKYTVSGPMALGAILANCDPAVRQALERFGDLLGLSYQIRNDLEPFQCAHGWTNNSDLSLGKRNIVLCKTLELIDAAGQARVRTLLERPLSLSECYELAEMIRSSGALKACADLAARLEDQALDVLRTSPLSSAERSQFLRLTRWLTSSHASTASIHPFPESAVATPAPQAENHAMAVHAALPVTSPATLMRSRV